VTADNAVIQLDNVSHAYGDRLVLDGLTLSARAGEFIAIVGPSGAGKTTLLGLLAGYLTPTRGSVCVAGQARMVHQTDGLFPWRTVRENVLLGLGDAPEVERETRLRNLLELVGLSDFADTYPHRLSGGMRQRAELARALAGDSEVLLLDEPFSALDYINRLRLRRELARLLAERPRTVALVTHDLEEAAQLADRVIVLSERPARARAELTVATPRPRDPTDPEVVAALREILGVMGLEERATVGKAGA
jgi:NitT/TauT family transport system ATP-binding protein